MMVRCDSIKQALVGYLAEHTSIQQIRDLCVVTLPIHTIDGRLVDVFVEHRLANYYFVHDGGKAASELILQGVDLTPSVRRSFGLLAQRMGVIWEDDMFQQGCKIEALQEAVMAVGSCSALAMTHLLGHVQEIEEQPLRQQIGDALRKWGKKQYHIGERVPVSGTITQHQFDFVAYPKTAAEPIAISILSPSGHPLSAAKNFGFKVKDLERTESRDWRQVVVASHSEEWTKEASKIITKCAQVVIPVSSKQKPTQALVGEHLRRLSA
jgi:hypothetical protein